MEPRHLNLVVWPAEPVARATVLGPFHLYQPDGCEIAISNKRARAILAMLCLTGGEPIERETLSRLLWPGRFTSHARASLRQCLVDLGKLLGPVAPDALIVTRNSVALRAGAICTDIDDAATLGKPILDQMDFGEPFTAWLSTRRQEIERRRGAEPVLLAPAPLPSPAENRSGVAILPFRSASPSPGQDYFADGMVDELITVLGRMPQLQVAGRTSSFHFRHSELPSARIAAELGVSYLIEGSVQRQGEAVRIHAHLVFGATGFEVWGDRFDGTLDTIFALQETVAQAVTRALASALHIPLPPPVLTEPTHSKEAYDLYLQGRALCLRVLGEGVLDTGIGLLEQALALDPDFAQCWVMLAEAHQMVAVYTQCPDRAAAIARMADCARRAMALDPALGYPRSLLGIERWINGDVVGALDLAFEAWRLEPGNPAVPMRLASLLIYCGRIDQAAPYVDAAVDQDPIDGRKYVLVWAVHMKRGDIEAACIAGQRVVDLGLPSMYLAVALACLGQHDLAVEQYLMTQRLVNTIIMPPAGTGAMPAEAMDAYWLMAAKGICSGVEADRQAYWQMLEFLYATLPDKGDLAITGPAIFTGNADLTFRALGGHGSAASMLALVALWIDVEPIRQIWQHPEFIPFAQRIGMAAAWDKYGWPDLLPPPTNQA